MDQAPKLPAPVAVSDFYLVAILEELRVITQLLQPRSITIEPTFTGTLIEPANAVVAAGIKAARGGRKGG